MTFHVGQKVVCVDDKPPSGFSEYKMEIRRGAVYTVSEVGLKSWLDGAECVRLAEVTRAGGLTTPFWARRFRPVQERKTDISIFTAMLKPSKRSVDA